MCIRDRSPAGRTWSRGVDVAKAPARSRAAAKATLAASGGAHGISAVPRYSQRAARTFALRRAARMAEQRGSRGAEHTRAARCLSCAATLGAEWFVLRVVARCSELLAGARCSAQHRSEQDRAAQHAGQLRCQWRRSNRRCRRAAGAGLIRACSARRVVWCFQNGGTQISGVRHAIEVGPKMGHSWWSQLCPIWAAARREKSVGERGVP